MNRLVALFLLFTIQGCAEISADRILDQLVKRAALRGDRTLDILLLSGGGEYGAYGTGFLRGWKSRTGQPMPRFDMVTGVSTGALIAPFAFAGDERSLAEISAEYTDNVSDIKPSFELLFFLKRDGGLLNRNNLEKAVARLYGESLVARAQPGFREGRTLLIGTTNLRTGLGAIWSAEDEWKRGSDGVSFFQRLLVASTAVPGAFAPVDIKGAPHVDGGVTSNTLLGLDLSDFRKLATRLRAAQITKPVRIRLWVISNKPTYPSPESGEYRSAFAVRDRADRLLFGLKEIQTVTRYWELAEAVNAGVPGLEMEVHYTAVPQDMAVKVTLKRIFDPAYMKKLDQYGFQRARGSDLWDRLPVSPYRPQ